MLRRFAQALGTMWTGEQLIKVKGVTAGCRILAASSKHEGNPVKTICKTGIGNALDRTTRALCLVLGIAAASAQAQSVLFDFDDLSAGSGLPGDYVRGNLTAHMSSASTSGGSFSIQHADVLGFTPVGFSGNSIYPNSGNSADILVSFSTALSYFSIMYAPEEYGCGDSSALMRVTGYIGTTFVATSTTTAPVPGTWPTGTLVLNPGPSFDNVVVHYDTPPACGDIGSIFMADNMFATPQTDKIFANGFE